MKALRAILGIAFIIAVAYVTFMLVPPYYNNYEFQDAVSDEARVNTYTEKPVEDMRDSIYRTAQQLDLPIRRDQINVRREGRSVAIWVDYTVHLDLPGYPLDLQFHPSSRNKSY
jgi:hypothetical protein